MKKRRLWNLHQIWAKKKIKNSEIAFYSEPLTSNTREPVELSFSRLSFIQGLGVDSRGHLLGMWGTNFPTKTEVWGAEPPYYWNFVTNCFLLRFWRTFHSRLFMIPNIFWTFCKFWRKTIPTVLFSWF